MLLLSDNFNIRLSATADLTLLLLGKSAGSLLAAPSADEGEVEEPRLELSSGDALVRCDSRIVPADAALGRDRLGSGDGEEHLDLALGVADIPSLIKLFNTVLYDWLYIRTKQLPSNDTLLIVFEVFAKPNQLQAASFSFLLGLCLSNEFYFLIH